MFIEKRLFKYMDYFFISELNQLPYLKMADPDFKYCMWSTGVNLDLMKPVPKVEARKILGWDINKKYILYRNNFV